MSDISLSVEDSVQNEINTFISRSQLRSNVIGITMGIIIGMILTSGVIAIAIGLIVSFRNQSVLDYKQKVKQDAEYIGTAISKFITVNSQSLVTLTNSVIEFNYTISDQRFRYLSSRLRLRYPVIHSFEYALGPYMTLEYVDPMPSPVIGLELLVYNARHAAQIRKSIANDTITMYGPFNLVQGGVGLTCIYPILYPNGTAFGISSILVMLDDVLVRLHLYQILNNYEYQFIDEYGIFAINNGTTLIGTLDSKIPLLVDSMNVTITLLSQDWILNIRPKGGWYMDQYIWLETLLIIFISLLLLMTSIIVSRQVMISIYGRNESKFIRDKLEQQVSSRTTNILKNNMLLISQLESKTGIENIMGLAWLNAYDQIVRESNEHFDSLFKEPLAGRNLNELFKEKIEYKIGKAKYRKLTLNNGLVIKATIQSEEPNKITIITSSIEENNDSSSNTASHH